jgi:hypothetical protein
MKILSKLQLLELLNAEHIHIKWDKGYELASYTPIQTMTLNRKEIEDIVPNFPNELLYEYEKEFLFPDFYKILKNKFNNTIGHFELWQNWLEEAKTHYGFNNQPAFSNETAYNYASNALFLELFTELVPNNILEPKFWKNYNRSFGPNQKNFVTYLPQRVNTLLNLFENQQDVIAFLNLLPDTYNNLMITQVKYRLLTKSLAKFADDYSLEKVPKILESRLKSAEDGVNAQMEALKALKKFNFCLVKPFFLYGINSRHQKVIDFSTEILNANI